MASGSWQADGRRRERRGIGRAHCTPCHLSGLDPRGSRACIGGGRSGPRLRSGEERGQQRGVQGGCRDGLCGQGLELQEGLVDVAAGALERLGETMSADAEEFILSVTGLYGV